MPYVNIKITDEQVSRADKEELVKRTTQMLQEVLNKNPETTVVVIDEVSTDNWGIGGELVSDRRRSGR